MQQLLGPWHRTSIFFRVVGIGRIGLVYTWQLLAACPVRVHRRFVLYVFVD